MSKSSFRKPKTSFVNSHVSTSKTPETLSANPLGYYIHIFTTKLLGSFHYRHWKRRKPEFVGYHANHLRYQELKEDWSVEGCGRRSPKSPRFPTSSSRERGTRSRVSLRCRWPRGNARARHRPANGEWSRQPGSTTDKRFRAMEDLIKWPKIEINLQSVEVTHIRVLDSILGL